MKTITSRENAQFKQLKVLASNVPARKRGGLALAEGIHLCQAYLQQGWPVQCVVSEAALAHAEVQPILQQCLAQNLTCLQLPNAMFTEISQLEHGIGILFVIEVPQPVLPSRLRQDAVLLDQVQDPGNMGSILRSAAAAGIKQIFCSVGCVQCWSAKVLRAGMGAHFLLEIYENVNLTDMIGATDIAVLATSSYAKTAVYDMPLTQPVAWLFGNEGQGVAPDLLELAQHQVVLPHLGAMESLNVAACAAICFFEQVRQKREKQ